MTRLYGTGQSAVIPNVDIVGLPPSSIGDSTAAALTASVAELNILDGVTASATEINKVDGLAANAYLPVIESRVFTQSGAGTYTATVAIPANSLVLEVAFNNIAVWNSATSAVLDVGDAGDAEGYFKDIDVKTTPAVGTTLSNLMSSTGSGAYKGLPKWYESQATITATIVATGATTAGTSRLNVIYARPTAVAATKA